MDREGPILEALTRRLAETPEEFLTEPRVGNVGQVHTAAVVGDLLRLLGHDVSGGGRRMRCRREVHRQEPGVPRRCVRVVEARLSLLGRRL